MIEALSTMLDAAVGRDGRSQAPLSEELKYVDAYLYITKERLGERLSECAVRGVKHLCAVVLRIAEFVEMNADKNRRGDILHDAFARVNIRDLVFAH